MIQEHSALLRKISRAYSIGEDDHNDLMQEMILQLWKAFPSFSGQSGEGTWLYRVAINTAISEVRKKKRKPEADNWTPVSIQNLPAPPQGDKEKSLEKLYRAISNLNPVDKAIIMLYLEKKTYKEIGEITGLSEKNISVKIVRIKNKLKKLMESETDG